MSDAETHAAKEEAARRIEFCLCKGRDYLHLNGLGLTELPQDFAKLTGLRYLDLTNNRLTKFPAAIAKFKDLRWLGLNDNQLEKIPDTISQLKNLERLYLRNNRLQNLPKNFGKLSALVELDLRNNRIANLPKSFLQLLQRDEEAAPLFYDLNDNPGQIAKVASEGREPLASYLQAMEDDAVTVAQGKLLLVGEGKVGKTTLLRALRGEKFEPNLGQTHGLVVRQVSIGEGDRAVQLNCWDFSGQERMRETHQMFFTAPAVYLVVWNCREGSRNQGNVKEWLWLINHRTHGKARVMVVATHSKQDRVEPHDVEELRESFDDMLEPPGFIQVECETGMERGIEELRSAIEDITTRDKSFHQTIPTSWEEAQSALESTRESRPFLEWNQFQKFCQEEHRIDDARTFASVQDRFGRLVWIDHGKLRDWVIVNADWLSKAVGRVLREEFPADRAASPGLATGLLPESEIEDAWANPKSVDEYDNPEISYPAKVFPIFHELMEAFDLSLANGRRDGHIQRLIPNRLASSKPRTWNDAWSPTDGCFQRKIALLGYDEKPLSQWLVSSFLFQLMVRMNKSALGADDYRRAAHWSRGFRLTHETYGEGRLLRIEADSHEFHFEAHGPRPESLWGILLGGMQGLITKLESDFEYDIKLNLGVPCGPDCDRPLANRFFVPEERLIEWVRKRVPQLPCTACGELLDPQAMLDGPLEEQSTDTDAAALHDGQAAILRGVEQISRDQRKLQEGVSSLLELQLQEAQKLGTKFSELHRLARQQTDLTDNLRADISSWRAAVHKQLQSLLLRFDSPAAQSPRLFSIVAEDPKFLSDKGRTFVDKYRLYLHCEETLLPVAWMRGTKDAGAWPLEISKNWWAKCAPVIRLMSPLLALIAPGAALVDAEAGKLLSAGKKQADAIDAILATADSLPDIQAPDALPQPQEAEREMFAWLQEFLVKKTGMEDLHRAETKLGLVRVYDKRSSDYRWVHRTQAEPFGISPA